MNPLRYIAVLTLMLAFAGQGIASVSLGCAADSTAAAQQTMDHHQHGDHHGAGKAGAEDNSDCCESGYCSQGGCLSLSLAAGSVGQPLPATAVSTVSSYRASPGAQLPHSLYRPPAIT